VEEIRRQQYLDALGLDSYMPRVRLPGAPVSRLIDIPEVALATVPAPAPLAAQQETPKAASAPTAAADLLRDMTSSGTPIAEQKPREKASLSSRQPAPVATVHLHLWRPLPTYIVLDDCPPGTALPTHRLLANILRMLHGQAVNPGSPERIRCPLNQQLAQCYKAEDIRRELHTWFAEAYRRQPGAQMWLLGDMASWFLPPDTKVPSSEFSRLPLALDTDETNGQVQALVGPSLSDILHSAALKASLWHAIKPT